MSIGVVISHDAVLDLSALLAQADHALYRAKDNGRNRVEVASLDLILDRAKRGRTDTRPTSGRRQDPPPDALPRHLTSAGVDVAGPSPTMSRTASSFLAPSKCTCCP